MHARYAAQWAVAGFRDVLRQVHARNPQGLLVVWDDHDFAWNNSQGGGFPAGVHSVRPEVKAVTRQLFLQFRGMVCDHPDTADYPPMPALQPVVPDQGVQQFGALRMGPQAWPFALLDNRWYRTPYPSPSTGATLLGPAQWAQLESMLATSEGLLVVLAGTPVQHLYRLSKLGEGWVAKDGSVCYPEYPGLLAARRPVLFLAGDIHHNEWGGRLYLTDAAGRRSSEVVQLCASAAAVGSMGPLRTLPSYGVVKLTGTPRAGTVTPRLMSLKQGVRTENPPLQADIAFDASRWQSDFLDGVAAAEDPWTTPDEEVLHVLTTRTLDRPKHWVVTPDPIPDGGCSLQVPDMDALDALYAKKAKSTLEVATPHTLQYLSDQSAFKWRVWGVRHPKEAPRTEHMEGLLIAAFQAARAAGRSVVFFIHGFGKSPAEAVMQAYQLRQSYPGVEPVLFSWPAGESGGFLHTYNDGKDAFRNALDPGLQRSLSGALMTLGQLASGYPDVNSVVLARSLGSVALGNVVNNVTCPNFRTRLSSVKRIVLSSAVLPRNHADVSFTWLAQLGLPVVVTVNQNDQALKLANWANGLGKTPLGVDHPEPCGPHDLYLDFTRGANVGRLHDYLFPSLSAAQYRVNHALLTQALFDPASLRADLTPWSSSAQVFDVT